MTKIKFVKIKGTWKDVVDSARTTIGLDKGNKNPSSLWKKKMLLAEHSPIRQLIIKWKWVDLMSWVSVHFVRHKIGIEHFVQTQRTDRTGINRDLIPQSQLINHECIGNAQTIINISRKRLCSQASLPTKRAWRLFLDKLRNKEPELVEVCVPECVYRGFCPELKPCGYSETKEYKIVLNKYREK